MIIGGSTGQSVVIHIKEYVNLKTSVLSRFLLFHDLTVQVRTFHVPLLRNKAEFIRDMSLKPG